MPSTGIERFISLKGGVANLPPELPERPAILTAQKVQTKDSDDPFSGLPTVQEVIERNRELDEAAKARRTKPQATNQSHFTPNYVPSQFHLLDLSHMRTGGPAPGGISFTPFLPVTRFCYKFVGDQWRQPLATTFFDANKIYDRPWDIYYVWSGHYETTRPTTFVPEHQLQALLNDINQAFPDAHININDELREDGLVVNYDGLPDELRPQWLGRSTSRDQYTNLVNAAPYTPSSTGKMPDARSLEAFKEKIDKAVDLAKAKSKAKRKAGQQVAIQRRQEINKQVFHTQRYLGLLPKKEVDLISGMKNFTLQPIAPEKAPPYPFELDTVVIAFDVEAHERSPKAITEVGVSTLDTRDLHGEAPGLNGENWYKHIRARHFRIAEYKHHRNHEFVEGCPDDFEFGTSEFVARNDLCSVLASCFHCPFSKQDEDGGVPHAESDTEEKRNIILLGHDINQDIAYLLNIGFSVLNCGSVLELLDTATMFKSYTQDNNPTSLGKILYHFDMTGWHLHNAGNDAAYTMQAMLAIAVKTGTERGTDIAEKRLEGVVEQRAADAVEMARERAKEDAEGWKSEPDEDGGCAIPPTEEVFESKKSKGKKAFYGPPAPGLYTSGGVPLDV